MTQAKTNPEAPPETPICEEWNVVKHNAAHESDQLAAQEAALIGRIEQMKEELVEVRVKRGVINGGIQGGDKALALYFEQIAKKETEDPPGGGKGGKTKE